MLVPLHEYLYEKGNELILDSRITQNIQQHSAPITSACSSNIITKNEKMQLKTLKADLYTKQPYLTGRACAIQDCDFFEFSHKSYQASMFR